jgi:hypothetical protein
MDALNNRSRNAAGLPCAATLATFLAVTLFVSFTPPARAAVDHAELFANSHGAFPVRWNRAEVPALQSVDSCDLLMNTFHPIADMGDVFIMRKDDPAKPEDNQANIGTEVRTCAQYHRACHDGFSAYSTMDMSTEAWFTQSSAMFAGLPAMRPALRSGFENEFGSLDLASLARGILGPSVDRFETKFNASPADLVAAIKYINTSENLVEEDIQKEARSTARRNQFDRDVEQAKDNLELLQDAGFASDELDFLDTVILMNLKHRLNQTGFASEELDLLDHSSTQIDRGYALCCAWTEGEKAHEAVENGCAECWQVSYRVQVEHDYSERSEWARLLARGDYDGDGWEDLLFATGTYSTVGSWRTYDVALFTRRDNGRLVDISSRFINDTDWRQKLPALRKLWAGNCGIPADQWFALHGTCGCSSEVGIGDRFNEKHGLHMRVKFEHGYMQGTYHCDRVGREMPIAGALAGVVDRNHNYKIQEQMHRTSHMGPIRTHVGMLDEYGIAEMHTAQIYFEWGFADGVFALTGYRVGNTQMETDSFELMGKAEGN